VLCARDRDIGTAASDNASGANSAAHFSEIAKPVLAVDRHDADDNRESSEPRRISASQ
jgi:hypothetical protein